MTGTLYRVASVHGHPGATGLLERAGQISWIGPGEQSPAHDRAVDLGGAWLAPAFVDAHVHVTSTGLAQTGLDLTGCPSLGAALQQVERLSRSRRGGVVLGTGWDETGWPEGRPPTARELDRASAGGVVYLARTDVHSAVASSALLAAVPGVAALPGHLPDGLVRQDAHHAVRRAALASVSPAQRASAQVAALDQMASVGIGCVHECGGPDIAGEDDFTALLALDHPVERVGYWGELGGVDRARELGAVGAAGDLFVDGSIGSHTACLSAPYVDAADRGQSYLDVEQIAEHIRACTVAGMQAGFHAIGDGAVAAVTEAFSRVVEQLGAGPVREARHRVEHLEMVSAEQIAVLVRCGVVASVQPVFDARWGGADGMYVARLGAGRAAAMNPFRQMVAAGLELALGSDSPVTPPDPWAGVRAAVNHQTGSGISSAAAFAAHTSGGWLAARRDGNGDLAVGRPATFAAWQGASLVDGLPDLRESDPTCLATLVGGRIAYA